MGNYRSKGADGLKGVFQDLARKYGIAIPRELTSLKSWGREHQDYSVPWLPRELQGFTPSRLGFTLHHAEHERDDGWFEDTFQDLARAVKYFAYKHFGTDFTHKRELIRIHGGESPWLRCEFPPSFIAYASQLSRQDPTSGGWDALLVDCHQRVPLVAGIVFKALVDKVFEPALFGASDAQTVRLGNHDETTLGLEGYRRTRERGMMVKHMMEYDLITPEFWSCVDRVAMEISLMLVPLVNLQAKESSLVERSTLRAFHQQVHSIVAVAGYFSMSVRRSETIIRFEFPLPGEWASVLHKGFNDSIYKKSKHDAFIAEKKARENANVNEELYRTSQELREHRQATVFGNFMSRFQKLEHAPAPKLAQPDHMAKVKIVLTPIIRRWTPVGYVQPPTLYRGERVTTIHKAQVVYFYGRIDGEGELAERKPTLQELIRGKKGTVHGRIVRSFLKILRPALFLVLAFAAFVLVLCTFPRLVTWLAEEERFGRPILDAANSTTKAVKAILVPPVRAL